MQHLSRPAAGTRWLVARLTASSAVMSVVVGIVAFIGAVVSTYARGGIPAPRVLDEFSYLLAGDTFAHGRLANPTHPLWQFFETFYELQQPTYVSKYPPAQGLFLALGQVLSGKPIVGVWISYALMCAALAWMLWAWVPRRWALAGALVATVVCSGMQFEFASWTSSYWGGAVAALGGALLFGGIGRVLRRPSGTAAAVMALGVGILANSRPYEGLLVSIVPGIAFVRWILRGPQGTLGWRLRTIGAPAFAVLVLVGAWMVYYNLRTTGSPLRMPYSLYENTYGSASVFIFGSPGEHSYRVPEMQQFYAQDGPPPRTLRELISLFGHHASVYWNFYAPVTCGVLLLLFPSRSKDQRDRLAVASLGILVVGLAVETWSFAHYAAPAVAPLLLLYTNAARRMRLLRIRHAMVGRQSLWIVTACLIVGLLGYLPVRYAQRGRHNDKWFNQRAALRERLVAMGGTHLVLVSYGARHHPDSEWVYNDADIDASPVVWARSLRPRGDSTLVDHFRGRRVWRIDAESDRVPFKLVPVNQ